MSESFPPSMSPEDAAEFRRRRKGRNIAVCLALLVVIGLLYAIALVKFKVH